MMTMEEPDHHHPPYHHNKEIASPRNEKKEEGASGYTRETIFLPAMKTQRVEKVKKKEVTEEMARHHHHQHREEEEGEEEVRIVSCCPAFVPEGEVSIDWADPTTKTTTAGDDNTEPRIVIILPGLTGHRCV